MGEGRFRLAFAARLRSRTVADAEGRGCRAFVQLRYMKLWDLLDDGTAEVVKSEKINGCWLSRDCNVGGPSQVAAAEKLDGARVDWRRSEKGSQKKERGLIWWQRNEGRQWLLVLPGGATTRKGAGIWGETRSR